MRLTNIRPGDVVRCDVKGRVFFAVVVGKVYEPSRQVALEVEPITNGVTYRSAKARDILNHYSKRGKA